MDLSFLMGKYESFLMLIIFMAIFIVSLVFYIRSGGSDRGDYEPRRIKQPRQMPRPTPIRFQLAPASNVVGSGFAAAARDAGVQEADEEDVEDESYRVLANAPAQVTTLCGYCGYDLAQGYIVQYIYTFEGAKKIIACPNCGRQFKPKMLKKRVEKSSYRDKYLEERHKVVEKIRNRRIILAEEAPAEEAVSGNGQDSSFRVDEMSACLYCKSCKYLEARDDAYWCPVRGLSVNPESRICDQYIISVLKNIDISRVVV